jgi:SNF2 family DNA or RNA helicase
VRDSKTLIPGPLSLRSFSQGEKGQTAQVLYLNESDPLMPSILHLFWQPDADEDYIQPGSFRLWLETGRPAALPDAGALADWLKETAKLPVPPALFESLPLALPSAGGQPLPGPERLAETGGDWPDEAEWRTFEVTCYRIAERPIHTLNDLHYRLIFEGRTVRAGHDFLFWYYYTQALKNLLLRDQYIPAPRYRKRGLRKHPYEIYGGWEFLPEPYERLLAEAVERMPESAAPGLQPESALRHCAETLLRQAVAQMRPAQALLRRLEGSFVEAACRPLEQSLWLTAQDLGLGQQWAKWRRRITASGIETAFQLGLQLHEPAPDDAEHWHLEFRAISRHDPSLQVPLADYWRLEGPARAAFLKDFGADFEQALLLGLGQAARLYPALWAGLDTAEPTGVTLDLETAFTFLTETAWVLEDSGFRVIVPAWWTPQGRRRAKLRMRAAPEGKQAGAAARKKSLLSLDELVQYRYDLTLGEEDISPEEWARLVAAKLPLVQFRGQWVVLDRERMAEMLEFWKQQGETGEALNMQDLLRRTAEEADWFEVDPEDALAAMLDQLRDTSRLEPVEAPAGLNATLRDYQKRGVAWLGYLERLGLSGCLADDMGLGKTMQVIARLLAERQGEAAVADPTLLIAPTSVIGNWRKEIERFAPDLRTLVHHGPDRLKDAAEFAAAAERADVVILSYGLALRDHAILAGRSWHRVVLDEAQNIKNPEAKQTKAILKLDARHRLALTGTPVENRLLDLWSIFNFLNPGYLGRQTQFRKAYETPIQRDNDPVVSVRLRRLVEPFILRRVKTDPNIIKDLPDKVENKQFCNLSREQASLYEAVVRDVAGQLEDSEGIQRQGLMLSTLMKLKQICNHPAQFLHDDSPFSPERSHKLERLSDMLGDVLAEGESALVFTQFTEIGEKLERHLKTHLDCRTYYLHGGTPRARREEMIARFQDEEAPPSVFVLSLKAGGVGITLTRANHVFHFDRWWNPAVEDQATDRAFRIGQTRNVFVHKFITLGTLEERIDQMIEDKKQVAGAIVGSDESWLARLDNDAFKQLIALNRAAILDD